MVKIGVDQQPVNVDNREFRNYCNGQESPIFPLGSIRSFLALQACRGRGGRGQVTPINNPFCYKYNYLFSFWIWEFQRPSVNLREPTEKNRLENDRKHSTGLWECIHCGSHCCMLRFRKLIWGGVEGTRGCWVGVISDSVTLLVVGCGDSDN